MPHRMNIHEQNPETGMAVALFLSAAGYHVATDFHDGSTFILAEAGDPEIWLRGDSTHRDLSRQMTERLQDTTIADEVAMAEMSSEFRDVA